MTQNRVTIRQLARMSGVSVGTVSRALNGYADVHPDTRSKIIELARELDYTPAAAARSLKTQRSHVMGVFLDTGEGHPDLQHPFFHEVLGSLKARLGHAGYDLLLFASERPGNGYGDHSLLKRARHHSVAGVALMGVDPADPELPRLTRAELPCVGLDLALEGPSACTVRSDSRDGAIRAVKHLYELGHRRIATITGMLESQPGADRLGGYREAVRELGLAYRDEYVGYGDFYAESGHRAAEAFLALDEPPTAIFAASDLMALGAIRAYAAAGRSVPAHVSITGFDDISLAAHVTPGLTTVRQDTRGLGQAVADALLAAVEGGEAEAQDVVLPVELVVRESTAPVPGG